MHIPSYVNSNSHLLNFRGKEDSFSTVKLKLESANLPVLAFYKDEAMGFYYKNGTCDANTAHHLEAIVRSLIALYKE